MLLRKRRRGSFDMSWIDKTAPVRDVPREGAIKLAIKEKRNILYPEHVAKRIDDTVFKGEKLYPPLKDVLHAAEISTPHSIKGPNVTDLMPKDPDYHLVIQRLSDRIAPLPKKLDPKTIEYLKKVVEEEKSRISEIRTRVSTIKNIEFVQSRVKDALSYHENAMRELENELDELLKAIRTEGSVDKTSVLKSLQRMRLILKRRGIILAEQGPNPLGALQAAEKQVELFDKEFHERKKNARPWSVEGTFAFHGGGPGVKKILEKRDEK